MPSAFEGLILDIVLEERNGSAEENPMDIIKNGKRIKKCNWEKTLEVTEGFILVSGWAVGNNIVQEVHVRQSNER